LDAREIQALQDGVLPSASTAGRALGQAARDLCGLRVGLVLGAGSVKGYAHYGVLRVLERIGLTADCVAGTSIGAIVASTYAMGWTADRALRDMEQTSWRAFRPTLPIYALLSNEGVHTNFRNASGDRRIEDLDMPLAIVCADLITGEEVVFHRGLMRTAALASMAIPGIYPPLRLGARVLVDGGILNPVPVTAATDMGADVVIAVSLSHAGRQASRLDDAEPEAGEALSRPPLLVQTLARSIEVMQSRIGSASIQSAAILVEPDFAAVPPVSLTTFHKGRPYVEPGERAAEAALPRISAALPWLRPAS
jgi:NTE family protein